jgi:hypothetical protein
MVVVEQGRFSVLQSHHITAQLTDGQGSTVEVQVFHFPLSF